MDFLTRILGGTYTPRKPQPKPAAEQNRFTKFQNVVASIQRILSSTKRDLAREDALLNELQQLFERLVEIIRQETRAPNPHLCVQFAATHQIFTIVNRAAAVSFHEGCIRAAIGLMSALVDSEEENFMASDAFAKSLMRLVSRVIDGGNVLLSVETETQIMELLFTITAKIRLQPTILRHWFSPTRRLISDEDEKQNMINTISKDDFQLAYILVDRVYHEGRIGDFSRTGILYIFEASSTVELSDWIITSSDICTLLASGLGALYSQLSRELNILHPDATLPAVLAMSDYNTAHSQVSAESAFSERHLSHMTTFLQYLLFWQDILAHTKSDGVKETLLDHFQIIFLQQLLYPSVLQSSDTDGSSVAILTYLKAIVEALEHTELIANILAYLLAVKDVPKLSSDEDSPTTSRSLESSQRRESLLSLTAMNESEDVVEPDLFNLGDLIQNSLASDHGQTVFSALQLVTTLFERQSRFAIGTILKVANAGPQMRTFGALQLELERYTALASKVQRSRLDRALDELGIDMRSTIETQLGSKELVDQPDVVNANVLLVGQSIVIQQLFTLLKSYWTNSIEVNMALTQSIVSLACCIKLRPDGWLAIDASKSKQPEQPAAQRSWLSHLDASESASLASVSSATAQPQWPEDDPVLLHEILTPLVQELDSMRASISGLDNMISARKIMLQATSLDVTIDGPFSRSNSPAPHLNRFDTMRPSSPAASTSPNALSPDRGRTIESQVQAITFPAQDNQTSSQAQGGELTPTVRLDTSQLPSSDTPESPSTTDVLMQKIRFQPLEEGSSTEEDIEERSTSLNHALTNIIILQEFILALVAVLQVRASILGEAEIRIVA